jgi:preprotein translocase subunit SecA
LDVVSVPTHRPMVRVDEPDIVYKTLEAKFRGIAWELLRLYTKQQPVLVGTRSIEMSEKVSARLTAEMLQKLLLVSRLRENLEVKKDVPKDQREDAKSIINGDLQELKKATLASFLPKVNMQGDALASDNLDWVLEKFELGASNREYLEEALKHGVPHKVLNAKYHEVEALIISEAGRKGAITIATNMAGRGVDILLGGRVADELVKRALQVEAEGGGTDEYSDTFASFRRGGKERAAPPLPLDDTERREAAEEVRALGGLFILGTERHESRRIDNQLRGRAGRQGDPGTSRFYVALEDQLWKIFNANMLENPLLRAWPPMEEVNAKFLSGMIRKTQERIENHFFEARKHVLEYDDVLNAQREHIYGWRREILLGKDVRADLKDSIRQILIGAVEAAWVYDEEQGRVFDMEQLYAEVNEIFPLVDYATIDELEQVGLGPELIEFLNDKALVAYEKKIEDLGEFAGMVEQQVMLRAVNDKWQDHLQTVEYIREGISLRSYGQVDPLVAYKRETFDLFNRTLHGIHDHAARMIFRAQIERQAPPPPQMTRMDEAGEVAENTFADNSAVSPIVGGNGRGDGYMKDVDWRKVGRNDPCPCGSGKKFKSCHYPTLRAEGRI